MKLILRLLKAFKFARKKIGGTWYFIELPGAGGIEGPIKYWTQRTPDEDEEILRTEHYG